MLETYKTCYPLGMYESAAIDALKDAKACCLRPQFHGPGFSICVTAVKTMTPPVLNKSESCPSVALLAES